MRHLAVLPSGHDQPSMSKSALLLSPCSKWADSGSRWYDEETRDPEDLVKRNDGIAFHEEMHWYITDATRMQCTQPNILKWLDHATKYVDQVLGPRCDTIQSEVAIGIEWSTGKVEVFPEVKNRNYPKRPGWQFGTADLVCILKTGELLIADWKTGGSEGAKEQLLTLGWAFRKAMSLPAHERDVIISCLSVNEDGVWPNETLVEQAELHGHAFAMQMKWEDLDTGKSKYEPGIHCTSLYCPHLAYCSAIVGAVEESAKQDIGDSVYCPRPPYSSAFRYTDSPTSNQEAGFTMSLISAARRQMKYTEAKLKEFIKHGGKVVAGGMTWENGSNGFRWRKN